MVKGEPFDDRGAGILPDRMFYQVVGRLVFMSLQVADSSSQQSVLLAMCNNMQQLSRQVQLFELTAPTRISH